MHPSFPWMSIWPLAKPHVDYCVDILSARWLRPVFAESYRLLRVNQAKELVTVRVWNALDQSLKIALQIRAICVPHPARCAGLAALPTIKIQLLLLNNAAVVLAFLLRKARLIFLDSIFSTEIFFNKVIQKSDCYWVLAQACTSLVLSKSEILLNLNNK